MEEKPVPPFKEVSSAHDEGHVWTSSDPPDPSHLGDEEKAIELNPTQDRDNDLSRSNSGIGSGVSSFLSRIRTADQIRDPGPPPDGGWTAWSQSLLSHLVVFNTWGYINSFGTFQTYYSTTLNHPPSDISWVGSMQIFLLFFIGTYSGRATDAGYFKLTFVVGSFMELLGIFMTSLSTKYWHLFLAQGVCTGIGNGLVFTSSVTVIAQYFQRKRTLAIGVAAAGAASGGMVYPAIVETCLHRIGFPWTVRIMGLVMLVTQIPAAIGLKPRLGPRRTGPIVEWSAFKELPYMLYAIGSFLLFWGLYFAFFYVGKYGRDVLGLSPSSSINLLLILNGVGFVSRIIPGYLADRWTGPVNMFIIFGFSAGLIIFCWAFVHTHAGLIGFSIAYGVFAGGIQSLFPASLSTLTIDMKKAGVRLGMVFSIVSFAALTGPPLAGALIQQGHGNYLYAEMWAGASMMGGFLTLVAARIAKAGWNPFLKV